MREGLHNSNRGHPRHGLHRNDPENDGAIPRPHTGDNGTYLSDQSRPALQGNGLPNRAGCVRCLLLLCHESAAESPRSGKSCPF